MKSSEKLRLYRVGDVVQLLSVYVGGIALVGALLDSHVSLPAAIDGEVDDFGYKVAGYSLLAFVLGLVAKVPAAGEHMWRQQHWHPFFPFRWL